MNSLPEGFNAIVIGASGAIGGAFTEALGSMSRCGTVVALSRRTQPALDVEDEDSVAAAAQALKAQAPFHLVINATGALHLGPGTPEKRLAELTAANLMRAFSLNAIAPALLIKHFTPLLPRNERGLFATLSARVGSISDNRLGGWYSYRAGKAAQNMLLKTSAIEVARRQPQAVLAALHPGTVRSRLSTPIIGEAEAFEPLHAAALMLQVLDALMPEQSGGFFAYDGQPIGW